MQALPEHTWDSRQVADASGPSGGVETVAGDPGAEDQATDPALVSDFPLHALFGPLPSSTPKVGSKIPKVGSRIGRFSMLRKLGQGGMGVVYLGYDDRLDRRAAIKLLRSAKASAQGRARMLREAQALARLSHPNVIPIYESGEIDDEVYIAMEYVDGLTLRDWLKKDAPREVAEILEVFLAAGRGLEAAHAEGLTHRDFKPDNIMIGNDGRARVMDFGLVHTHEQGALGTAPALALCALELPTNAEVPLTATGAMLGTPAYMAPEQYRGDPTGSHTDQFSYCVTLWEALYGQRPFVGATLASLATNILDGTITAPPANAKVPARLRQVLERGLARDPARRWPSLAALLAALEDGATRRRRRLLVPTALAAIAGLVASVATVTALATMRQRSIALNEAEHEERQLDARRQALHSATLRAEGEGVAALVKAIDAASAFAGSRPPKEVSEALHEATSANLRWGQTAECLGTTRFVSALAFAPDGLRVAEAYRKLEWSDDVTRLISDGSGREVIEIAAVGALDGEPAAPTVELSGHACIVSDLEFSADGSRVMARCYEDPSMYLWDAHSGALVASHAGSSSPEFSASANVVATDQGGEALLHSATSGETLATLGGGQLGRGQSIEFSSDGAVAGAVGSDGFVRLWAVPSGEPLATLDHPGALGFELFEDGSERIATVGSDQRVRVWSLGSGELLFTLPAPPTPYEVPPQAEDLHGLAVSSDGARVALYLDRRAWLWDTLSHQLVAEFEDHARNQLDNDRPWVLDVRGAPLEFSPRGDRLLMRRHDMSIHLFDSNSGALVSQADGVLSFSFSPDGESLAVGAHEVEIWALDSGSVVASLPGDIPNITSFSPGGDLFATRARDADDNYCVGLWRTTSDPSTLTTIEASIDVALGAALSFDGARVVTVEEDVARLWDARSGAALGTLTGHAGLIRSISTPASPGSSARVATGGDDGTVRLWKLDSGAQEAVLRGHEGGVAVLAFSSNGATLASAGDDHTVRLWDPSTGAPIGDPIVHDEPVAALSLTADGALLASASGGRARVWDTQTGALSVELSGHEDGVEFVIFSPDGQQLATRDGYDTVRLWSATMGALVHEMSDDGLTPPLAFSPDGGRLASTRNLWDVSSGALIHGIEQLEGRPGRDKRLTPSFSPDGTLLVVGENVFDGDTGSWLGRFAGHARGVHAASFTGDGARVVTAGRDSVLVRDAEAPVVAACARLRPYVAYAQVATTCVMAAWKP